MQHNRLKPVLLAVTLLATVLTLFAANSSTRHDIPATGGLSLGQWSPSDVLSISQKVMVAPADTVIQHTDNIKK